MHSQKIHSQQIVWFYFNLYFALIVFFCLFFHLNRVSCFLSDALQRDDNFELSAENVSRGHVVEGAVGVDLKKKQKKQ